MLGKRVHNFRIVRLLGEGGMGTVYEAEHLLIRRKVAVKVLKPELLATPELVQRFFNEARATSAIRHPNIIEVLDVGRTNDGIPYLVMELLEGESLADRLDRVGHLAPRDAVEVGRQAASAIEAAHQNNIVHRDLKPDNLFLVRDQRNAERELIKVLDFGIAKLRGDPSASSVETMAGALFGTPGYMSPEQCRGVPGEVDHRTDIYALGIILYEALCGRLPFEAEGVGEMMMLHMASEPTPPSALRDDVPPRLERVVLTALAKRREDRFATMAELGAALDASMSGGALAGDAAAAVPKVWAAPARLAPEPVSETAVTARMDGGASLQPAASSSPLDPGPDANRPRRSPLLVVATVAVLALLVFLGLRSARSPVPARAPATAAAESTVNEPPATASPPVAMPAMGGTAPALRGGASIEHAQPASAPAPQPSTTPATVHAVTSAPRASRSSEGKRSSAQRVDSREPSEHATEAAPAAQSGLEPAPEAVVAPHAPLALANPPPAANGYLSLDSAPWSNVLLAGKMLGTTPLVRVPLPPGKYVLTLQNPELGKSTSYVVEIKSGATVKRMVGWK